MVSESMEAAIIRKAPQGFSEMHDLPGGWSAFIGKHGDLSVVRYSKDGEHVTLRQSTINGITRWLAAQQAARPRLRDD